MKIFSRELLLLLFEMIHPEMNVLSKLLKPGAGVGRAGVQTICHFPQVSLHCRKMSSRQNQQQCKQVPTLPPALSKAIPDPVPVLDPEVPEPVPAGPEPCPAPVKEPENAPRRRQEEEHCKQPLGQPLTLAPKLEPEPESKLGGFLVPEEPEDSVPVQLPPLVEQQQQPSL